MASALQPVWLYEDDVPELPEGWRILPTEEACIQLKPGKLYDTKTVEPSGTVPVLNQSEVGFLGFHNDEPGVIATPAEPVVTFANHTCAMRLMKEPFSSIQNVFPKVGKPGITDTTYFYYATIGRVGFTDYKGHHPLFRQMFISVPPLPTQRRIAGILSAYDELIANNQRRIGILEEMARALYREWFVYYRAPDVVLGADGVPEGWEVKPLASLITYHIGGGWGSDVGDDKHTEPAYVIRGADIPETRVADIRGVPFRYHTPSNLKSRRLEVGDIIFEVSGGTKNRPLGRTVFMTEELLGAFASDVICASFCKRITPDQSFGAELMYLSFQEGYVSGEIEQFQVQSTGLSNFKWNEYIEQTTRLVPPLETRTKFRQLVAPFFSQIASLGLQSSNLRCTRDLLLPRLMSGRVEVNNIEA